MKKSFLYTLYLLILTMTSCTLSMEEFPSPEDLWQRFRQARAYTPEEEELIQQPYYFADNVNTPRYYQIGRAHV